MSLVVQTFRSPFEVFPDALGLQIPPVKNLCLRPICRDVAIALCIRTMLTVLFDVVRSTDAAVCYAGVSVFCVLLLRASSSNYQCVQ